ncbi:MAG: hypothetical protein HY578_06125 [Nitrospinae bacterium]|nr:hypothetical protein [Nitrospinota bacterium]
MNVLVKKLGKEINMIKKNVFIFIIIGLLVCFSIETVLSNKLIIKDGVIESIKIGESAKKIFSIFKSRYRIDDVTKPHSVRTITLFRDSKKVITFSIDPTDPKERIFLIYVYSDYVTPENIGSGSTLFEAINVYGNGNIIPTDEGYMIAFNRLKGIAFLLNNDGIPKELQNIPDDVFTPEQEKKIMAFAKKIRISAIQIFMKE